MFFRAGEGVNKDHTQGCVGDPNHVFNNREFKIPWWRRRRKSHLKKSDFLFFKTSRRLSLLAYFIKCRRTLKNIQVQKRNQSFVHVLTKMWNLAISRRSRAVTAKKWNKKCTALAELLICDSKPVYNCVLFWCPLCRRLRDIFNALMFFFLIDLQITHVRGSSLTSHKYADDFTILNWS